MPEFGLVHYNYKGSLEEFLDFASTSGFSCTELMANDVWDFRKGESFANACKHANDVHKLLNDHGMRASALAPGNDFLVTSADALHEEVERMRQFCELAHIIGTPILRIDGGWAKPEIPVERELYIDLITTGIISCCDFVEAAGLKMALDNHGLVTNDADLQVAILKRVNSSVVGANMDTMNYRWAGHDLETVRRFYDIIAPWVIHLHCKDGCGSRDTYKGTVLGEGEIPLQYAVERLKASGYNGPWLVEFEGRSDHAEGFRRGLQWLQANISA